MDRAVLMLVIGLVLGGGLGLAIAAGGGITLDGHDHADPARHETIGGHDHAAMAPLTVPAGPDAPTLAVDLTPDPLSGWNLHLQADRFRFAPDRAGADPREGEGHAHLYVNGVKTMRLYGDWTHLETLPQGEVTVRVALYGNDHRPIHVDGMPVADSVTLTVP